MSSNNELLLAQDDYSATALEPTAHENKWIPPKTVASAVTKRMASLLQAGSSSDEIVATIKNEFEHSESGPGEIIKLHVALDDGTSELHIIDTGCNNEEAEEALAPKSFFSATKKRHFVLKVALPVGITAVIFYVLCKQYIKMFQVTPTRLIYNIFRVVPNTLYAALFGESWSHYLLRAAEIATAIGRLSAMNKHPNNLIVHGLRIANGLLFLINKKQFSQDAFKDGAYYSAGWLTYDLYHFLNSICNDTELSSNTGPQPLRLIDNNYERLGKTISAHVLPLAESLSALCLALDNNDTPATQKDRLRIQSICSLARTLSLYLKENRESIDVLLVVHLLITMAEFFRDPAPEQGNTGWGNAGVNNHSGGINNPPPNNNPQQNNNPQANNNQPPNNNPPLNNFNNLALANNQRIQQPVQQNNPRYDHHAYLIDTALSEAVAQQVEHARNIGLEPIVVPMAIVENLANNMSPNTNQRFNDLINQQIAYARTIGLDPG